MKIRRKKYLPCDLCKLLFCLLSVPCRTQVRIYYIHCITQRCRAGAGNIPTIPSTQLVKAYIIIYMNLNSTVGKI